MRSTLDEFEREISELQSLVDSINPVNDALAHFNDPGIRRYIQVRRRFDYAAFIVALYTSYERFIEELVASYVILESGRLDYSGLPQRLKEQHVIKTAEILMRRRVGEGRYKGLTELLIVKNLFDCLNGARPYVLNKAAVIAHDANLRPDQIDQLFTNIGIEQVCQKVRQTDDLLDWYRGVKELESNPQDGIPASLIEERIRDLVERRNQIAHGGGNPLDLLGVEDMLELLTFVLSFARSVFRVVAGKYLDSFHGESSPGRVELLQRKGDGPYQGGRIVVVEPPTQKLFVGQAVFVSTDAANARWGKIQSIQLSGVDHASLPAGTEAPEGIGLSLDFRCPKGATIIALESVDHVIWSS